MFNRAPLNGKFLLLAGFVLALLSVPAAGKIMDVVLPGNGGFESQSETGSGLEGWKPVQYPVSPDAQSCATLTWATDEYLHGIRSVSIAIAADCPDTAVDFRWIRSAPGFRPEMTYDITGWVKTENVKTTPYLMVQCWTRDMARMVDFETTQEDFQVTGTQDWTEIKTSITLPQDTWRVMLVAGLPAEGNAGAKVWFDDVLFQRPGIKFNGLNPHP